MVSETKLWGIDRGSKEYIYIYIYTNGIRKPGKLQIIQETHIYFLSGKSFFSTDKGPESQTGRQTDRDSPLYKQLPGTIFSLPSLRS